MLKIGNSMTRRLLLQRTGATLIASTSGGLFMPYLSRAADRPMLTHGVQAGDVGPDGAIVWARADRPSRVKVEFSTTDVSRRFWARCLPMPCPRAT